MSPTSSTPGRHRRHPFETRVDVLVDAARSAERLGFSAVSLEAAMSLATPVVLAQLGPVELSTAVLAIWSARPVAHHRGLVGQLGPPLLGGGRIAMP